MAVPDFQSVMLPFLEALQDGRERTMRELTEALAVRFKLTDKERQEHLASGPQSLFYNRVAWAKTHLKNAGLINNPVRGKVSIAETAASTASSRRTNLAWTLCVFRQRNGKGRSAAARSENSPAAWRAFGPERAC